MLGGDQRVGVGDPQGIAAFAGLLRDGAKLGFQVEDVGVVADTPGVVVDPGLAVEEIVATVAGQAVGQDVAGAGNVAAASQREVFEVGAQGPAHRGLDAVDFGHEGAAFGDEVKDVIDDIGVVAKTPDQGVGAQPAVQDVGAAVAGDEVLMCVTAAVDIRRTRQREVLQVGAQRPGQR